MVELLVGIAVTLIVAGITAGLIAAFGYASLAQPQAADEQQRVRAAAEQVAGWLAPAGQGVSGSGPNEGWLSVPPLYPQRRGVSGADPDTAAFVDRITIVAGVDPPAGGRLGTSMATPASPVALDTLSCGAGLTACGVTTGSRALIADARAAGEWFTVTRVDPGTMAHDPPTLSSAYAVHRGTMVTSIDVRSLSYDTVRHQLRASTPGGDFPFLDGVAGFDVRWFADPRPPRGPLPPPGENNCVVEADGSPRLAALVTAGGPWVELSTAAMSDGPWCGAPPWRFDADLFRIRLVRITLALQRARLPGPAALAGPVPSVEIDVSPRNMLRLR
jgi:hypothetical protein